jgi:hypothetical protein
VSRAAVEQLVYLLDEAFEGIEKPWHSVLGNLASVAEVHSGSEHRRDDRSAGEVR